MSKGLNQMDPIARIMHGQIRDTDPSVPISTSCCYTSLPPTDYGTTIKPLHTRAVTIFKSFLSTNRVFQSASPQIAPEEANLPRPYKIAPSIPIVRG